MKNLLIVGLLFCLFYCSNTVSALTVHSFDEEPSSANVEEVFTITKKSALPPEVTANELTAGSANPSSDSLVSSNVVQQKPVVDGLQQQQIPQKLGPEIMVDLPLGVYAAEANPLEIRGRVTNVQDLYLNNKKLYVKPNGRFYLRYKLSKGLNVLSFKGVDKHHKSSEVLRKVRF